ncbi:MAG: response regulator [bacterium]
MSEDPNSSAVVKELLGMVDEFLQHMAALEAENQDLRERLSSSASQEIVPVEEATAVLVVDPDVGQAKSLSGMLEKKGCQTTHASSSAEALRLCGEKEFGLIIVESELGDGSGLELLAKLREAATDAEQLIIVGFSSADIAVQALRVGASGFLLKPLTEDDVTEKLDDIFKQHQLKLRSKRYLNNLRSRYQKLLKNFHNGQD